MVGVACLIAGFAEEVDFPRSRVTNGVIGFSGRGVNVAFVDRTARY